jgi:hypothetical protein
MSLWFVDRNQRTKKPGLWSLSWRSAASDPWKAFAPAAVSVIAASSRGLANAPGWLTDMCVPKGSIELLKWAFVVSRLDYQRIIVSENEYYLA